MSPALFNDFSLHYNNPVQQGACSEWPPLTAFERFLSWLSTNEDILILARGFGRWGTIVPINNKYFLVNNLEVSSFDHCFPDGELFSENDFAYSIATREGIAILGKKDIIRGIFAHEAERIKLPKFDR